MGSYIRNSFILSLMMAAMTSQSPMDSANVVLKPIKANEVRILRFFFIYSIRKCLSIRIGAIGSQSESPWGPFTWAIGSFQLWNRSIENEKWTTDKTSQRRSFGKRRDGSNNDKLGGLRRNNEAGNSGLKRAITSPPPTSCVSLYQLGNQISGFYLVKDNMAGNTIQTIYCDFNLL